MSSNRFVNVLFYIFPIVIFVQLAYGLVVREPYPSFMMPGFSRIDNDGSNYQLVDRKILVVSALNDTLEFDLDMLQSSTSKIAISRMIDLAFFDPGNAKTENSAQKKYYGIIKSFVGAENYKNHILDVRYPPVDDKSIRKFKKWLRQNIGDRINHRIEKIFIQRIEETRDFKTGDTLHKKVLDEIELTDD